MKQEIHDIYKREEIDFLLNKGFRFFLTTWKSTSRYSGDTSSIELVKKESELTFKKVSSSYDLPPETKELSNKDEIISHIRYGYDRPELSEEFFYIFYGKYPKYRKELLNNNYRYFSVNIKKNLPIFIKKTSKNYAEAAKNILEYPISVLTVTSVDFNELNNELKLVGGNEEQLFSFWLSFFKARKNQIQNPTVAPMVADFLSSKFNYEKLQNFFPFFTFLQAKYEYVEPDIFDGDHNFETSVIINLKKMSKVFSLDNWDYREFENALKIYMVSMKKHYKLDEALFSDMSRAKKIFNMSFFHNNEKFTKDFLKSRIVKLFDHFQSTSQDCKEIKDEALQSWLKKQDLEEELSNKDGSKKKTNKI